MTEEKKISTLEADKERLLEALRELRKDGVTIIDDRVGRPAVISAKPRAAVKPGGPNNGHGVVETVSPTEKLILENIDRMFIEESVADNDPYNKSIK